LGRMDVDIQRLRIDVEEEHDGRMAVEVERLCCAVRCVGQNPIADEAPVDEEELIASAAEAKATGHEAGGVRGVVTLVNLLQIRRRFVAQNLNHPFPKRRSCWQVE